MIWHNPKASVRLAAFLLISALLATSLAPPLAHAVPPYVSFQGRLTTTGGGAVSAGDHAVIIRIYSAPTGGTLVYSQDFTVNFTAEMNGVFNVMLGPTGTGAGGAAVQLADLDLSGGGWYVETVVDGIAIPGAGARPRLASVPTALTTKHLRGGTVVAGPVSSGFSIIGTKPADSSDLAPAVLGINLRTTPAFNPGVEGRSYAGIGIRGLKQADSPDELAAIEGKNPRTAIGKNPGVKGESTSGIGVWGRKLPTSTDEQPAVYGENPRSTAGDNPGVKGKSTAGIGIFGETAAEPVEGDPTTNAGVKGTSTAAQGIGVIGVVLGTNTSAIGVAGTAPGGTGVLGNSTAGAGVLGLSQGAARGAVEGSNTFSGTAAGTMPMKGIGVLGRGDPGVKGESRTDSGTFGMLGYDPVVEPDSRAQMMPGDILNFAVPAPTPALKDAILDSAIIGLLSDKYFYGAYGQTAPDNYGVLGYKSISGGTASRAGVYGKSSSIAGVFEGENNEDSGAFSYTDSATQGKRGALWVRNLHTSSGDAITGIAAEGGEGVTGISQSGFGVHAITYGTSYALYAENKGATGDERDAIQAIAKGAGEGVHAKSVDGWAIYGEATGTDPKGVFGTTIAAGHADSPFKIITRSFTMTYEGQTGDIDIGTGKTVLLMTATYRTSGTDLRQYTDDVSTSEKIYMSYLDGDSVFPSADRGKVLVVYNFALGTRIVTATVMYRD